MLCKFMSNLNLRSGCCCVLEVSSLHNRVVALSMCSASSKWRCMGPR